MRLADIPALLLEDVMGKVRRWAIAGAVALVCGVGATIQAVSAARVALEPIVGPAAAHLIIMGVFLVMMAVTVAIVVLLERRASRLGAARRAKAPNERAAILAEAISLGYSLGEDFAKAAPSPAADGDSTRRSAPRPH